MYFNFYFILFFVVPVAGQKKTFGFPKSTIQQSTVLAGPLYGHEGMSVEGEQAQEYSDKLIENCRAIEDFLEHKTSVYKEDSETNALPADFSEVSAQSNERSGSGHSLSNQYFVESSLVERWGNVMGIHMIFSLMMIW